MSVTVTHHQRPSFKGQGIKYTRASIPFAAGELVAYSYANKPGITVVYVDEYQNVTCPQMSKINKAAWDAVVSAIHQQA